MDVQPTGQACGASVRGIDLRQELSAQQVAELRSLWLRYRVLVFPDQDLTDDDLERFTLCFGPFGTDPFFEPIDGRNHIAAVHRAADEQSSLFADVWHADWTFQARPPDGTCLYAKIIPPVGGDTLFSDQTRALAAMPPELRAKIDGLTAIHSARGGYAPDGAYGEDDSPRAMRIIYSDEAYQTQTHPLIRRHPETGMDAVYSTHGYIIDLEDVPEAFELLRELADWQYREEFQYRHRWEQGMLVMWDNRSILHRATGGYEGHERLLHRTTIGSTSPVVPAS